MFLWLARMLAHSRVQVLVKAGEPVEAGRPLLVLTAMKMETALNSPVDGVVGHIAVIKGDTVDAGDLLVRITHASGSAASSIDGGDGVASASLDAVENARVA